MLVRLFRRVGLSSVPMPKPGNCATKLISSTCRPGWIARRRNARPWRSGDSPASLRALAVAAASGGGADDPTVVNAIAGIDGEGEYRALTRLYEGDQEALSKEAQADANRRGAKATKKAALFKAAGSILSAGSGLADKYG